MKRANRTHGCFDYLMAQFQPFTALQMYLQAKKGIIPKLLIPKLLDLLCSRLLLLIRLQLKQANLRGELCHLFIRRNIIQPECLTSGVQQARRKEDRFITYANKYDNKSIINA